MFEQLTQISEKHQTFLAQLDIQTRQWFFSIKGEVEKAVKDTLKEFFAMYPEVKKIRWTQYTPFFNDGDPCVFGIRELEVQFGLFPLKKGKDQKKSDDWYHGWELKEPSNMIVSLKQLDKILASLKEILKEIFGDQVRVIADPEKMEIEEYNEHD